MDIISEIEDIIEQSRQARIRDRERVKELYSSIPSSRMKTSDLGLAVSFFSCEDQLFGDMLKCLLGVVRCIRDGDSKPEDVGMDPVVNIKMLLSKSLFYQLFVNCEQVKPDCSKAFEKYTHEDCQGGVSHWLTVCSP